TPHQQAGYTKATLSLLLMLQRLAKWEETIYEFTCARRFIGYSANNCIWKIDEDEIPLVE
ncbi:MAG: hypothetical protein WBN51_01820, partial [Gammaproteobacteria bacterium]